jgi:hypothetical protein
MTGISLHMQWPLTSQLHGSVSQREQLFFSLRNKLHAHKKYFTHSVLDMEKSDLLLQVQKLQIALQNERESRARLETQIQVTQLLS